MLFSSPAPVSGRPIALPSQPEGSGAIFPPASDLLPFQSTSADLLTHATESAAHCYLHRRVSTANGAACCSKKAQTSPTIATTEVAPKAAAAGGHGDVLGASIDEGPAGLHRPARADRCQRPFAIASHSLGPMS